MISFETTSAEREIVTRIVNRARKLGDRRKPLDITMDLCACHANGCPLDFARLEQADDFNLMHDIYGVARHLNRDTGQLENFFVPRFSAKAVQS